MKKGSFRDTVRKTVGLLTRDNVEVVFRGFQPCVITQGDKVIRMVLPEVGDDAPEELIEAMHGFIDHECGHIFYTAFGRAQSLGQGKPLKAAMLNIIEDIRLEKLLPRDLPGTKDNLERMYEKMIDKFWGAPIKRAIDAGYPPERMLSVCTVVAFRALAGQKRFQQYMDDNGLWQFMQPLLARYPKLAQDLQGLETYDDVVRVTEAVLEALDAKTKQQMDEDAQQQAQQQQQDEDDDAPPQQSKGAGGDDSDEDDADNGDGDGEGSDDGDDEGEGSSGDDEDGDESDSEGGSGAEDGEGDDDSEDEADSKSKGGKGHGDGEGEDDGSDEEGGECAGDQDGDPNPDHDGNGDGDRDDSGVETDELEDGNGGGKSNRTITDAVKSLEATQRKVLYLHKKKRRSVERIAEQMKMSEDEVRATLAKARRSLAEFMTGDQ